VACGATAALASYSSTGNAEHLDLVDVAMYAEAIAD
jgi:hypothetical protein